MIEEMAEAIRRLLKYWPHTSVEGGAYKNAIAVLEKYEEKKS